jgi:hypothetical protein
MAIQIEGKALTLRWDDNGLTITKINDDIHKKVEYIQMSPDQAIEFTNMFTMGQHAISVAGALQFMPNREDI